MFNRSAIVLFLLFVLMLFSCRSIDRIPDVELPKNDKISFLIWSIETKSDRFDIKIVLGENTEYEGLVQEIVLDNGQSLVEYFRLPHGKFIDGSYDHHVATGIVNHIRSMRIYPANVDGVDYQFGDFAQLPQNMDGSLKTNIGPLFNRDYQKDHKTQGKVIKDDRDNSIYWSIVFHGGIVTVVLPDNTKITLGNTIG